MTTSGQDPNGPTARGATTSGSAPAAGPDPTLPSGLDPALGTASAVPGRGRSRGHVQDRRAERAAVRAFRPRRRVPAVLVATVLTLLGLLVAAETISALVGRPLRLVPYDRMLAGASATPWANPWVLLGSALALLLGLALLAAALVPGRPRLLPVRTGDPDLVMGLRRKSVTHALAHAAEQVPGVHEARARIRGRTVAVTPVTSGWDGERFREGVREAVLTRLAELDLVEPYRVAVEVKERR
ncbi:DUF6286 domain-containing protein [Actinomadura sp. ATCC 31491]|uniref:DUF6286 domain-containing protein n=1 Tax=Actinomadura luzonensis TaxID=2805427 RepID=A0ABT0FKA6_9ACTN|nr:DUF6286 domain-containing protein [Actinomadura luzonensis]MCK2212740.1 DUF6286 domain-containing protein [Actinomadura luzonensis]